MNNRRSEDRVLDKLDELSVNVTKSLTRQQSLIETQGIHGKQIRSLEKSNSLIKGVGSTIAILITSGATWIGLTGK